MEGEKLVYYTGGIAATNGYALSTAQGTLVVDAPHGIADWLEREQLKPAALILTHQHFDHVQHVAEVVKRWTCPVYAWSAFSRSLTLELLEGRGQSGMFYVPEYHVTHVLEGRDKVQLLGLEWSIEHIPGHSLDSMTLYQRELGLLFSGDVLFAESIGRTDFPGGSMEQLVRGISKKLLPLADSTRVLPGHGDETTIGHERDRNPYLQD